MKKGIMFILAVMVVSAYIHVNGMASPSPEADTIVGNTAVQAVDADGKEIQGLIITSRIPEEYKEVERTILSEEGFGKIVDTLKVAEAIGASSTKDLILIDLKEVWAPEGTKFPITITFSVKGVDESTRGTILHYNDSQWEIIPTTMGKETMTGVFESLSPVAFVVDKTSLPGTEYPEGGTENETAPQTGESSRRFFHVAFGFSATLVLYLLWKKRNAVV